MGTIGHGKGQSARNGLWENAGCSERVLFSVTHSETPPLSHHQFRVLYPFPSRKLSSLFFPSTYSEPLAFTPTHPEPLAFYDKWRKMDMVFSLLKCSRFQTITVGVISGSLNFSLRYLILARYLVFDPDILPDMLTDIYQIFARYFTRYSVFYQIFARYFTRYLPDILPDICQIFYQIFRYFTRYLDI